MVNSNQKVTMEEKNRKILSHRTKISIYGRPEPVKKPFDGSLLIFFGVLIALISFVLHDFPPLFYMVLAFASIFISVGVIRCGVEGAQLFQLDRLQRQNCEIIHLLETLLDKSSDGSEIELLRRLRDSGQITQDEYSKQRRKLFTSK